ncbi:MAG: hypothetical protein BWX54_01607 [Verrucomicrobia bacterium ADurb.Bin018]|nr:MAG: hypothetical protein BWX54_01607 [Verrucomicrobia bacterium ADurb.Bin018]
MGPATGGIIGIIVGGAAALDGANPLTVGVVGIGHYQTFIIGGGGKSSGRVKGLGCGLAQGILDGDSAPELIIGVVGCVAPGIGDAGELAISIIGVRRAISEPVGVGADTVIHIGPGFEGVVAGIGAPNPSAKDIIGVADDQAAWTGFQNLPSIEIVGGFGHGADGVGHANLIAALVVLIDRDSAGPADGLRDAAVAVVLPDFLC